MWELDYKESSAPKNWCFWTVVLEKTLESPLDYKEIQPVHPKGNQSWIFIGRTDAEAENSNTLATWCKELTHLKRPWFWERLKVGRQGNDRGWDGWMASPIQWTWAWVNSRNWWWMGRPGVLQSMGLQSPTRLSDWTELKEGINTQQQITLKPVNGMVCDIWNTLASALLLVWCGYLLPNSGVHSAEFTQPQTLASDFSAFHLAGPQY